MVLAHVARPKQGQLEADTELIPQLVVGDGEATVRDNAGPCGEEWEQEGQR